MQTILMQYKRIFVKYNQMVNIGCIWGSVKLRHVLGNKISVGTTIVIDKLEVVVTPASKNPGGRGTPIYWLYGYVPLERVWVSSHLLWDRV